MESTLASSAGRDHLQGKHFLKHADQTASKGAVKKENEHALPLPLLTAFQEPKHHHHCHQQQRKQINNKTKSVIATQNSTGVLRCISSEEILGLLVPESHLKGECLHTAEAYAESSECGSL